MRCMRVIKHCFISLFLFIVQTVTAQINYGTTGLMNLPTADMQRDKTFMAGGNWLNHHATVPRWWYDTWNYYINITIFPWLEAGYLCTGHKAVPTDYGNNSGYWPLSPLEVSMISTNLPSTPAGENEKNGPGW